MGKTIEEYKKELESQITSFKNIHYALNSASWHLEYDRHYHLTLVFNVGAMVRYLAANVGLCLRSRFSEFF